MNDRRAPIIFLRSFSLDEQQISLFGFFHYFFLGGWYETDEQILTRILAPVGPVIAIGKPGEPLPTLGAYRAYVDDDSWQDTVSNLMSISLAVILQIGPSKAIFWELETASQVCDPERVVIFHPFRKYRRGRKSKKWKSMYDDFRRQANQILPRDLPAQMGRSQFIHFDHAWTPMLIEGRPRFAARLRGAFRMMFGLFSGLHFLFWRYALNEAFKSLGVTEWSVPLTIVEKMRVIGIFVVIGIFAFVILLIDLS